MTMTSKVPNQAEPVQVELVRSFFDQPQNYLERKRFDMRIRAETTRSFLKGDELHADHRYRLWRWIRFAAPAVVRPSAYTA